MKKVRIAQVGTGHDHARGIFENLMQLPDYFEFVGVAEPNPERLKDIYPNVPHYTVEELLEMDDLDAVAIETEESLSTQYAQLFADKGIAIHMDKPGAQNIEAFERLIHTVKEKKLPFNMGYMYRFNPIIRRAIERAQVGELGEIFSVEAHMSIHYDRAKRDWLSQFKGGQLYFLGCHLIDLVYTLQGEPDEVLPLSMSTGLEGCETEDYGFAALKYKNGVSFVKSCTTELGGFDRRQIVICGSRGTIEIKPTETFVTTPGYCMLRTRETVTLGKMSLAPFRDCPMTDEAVAGRYENMLISFARMVRGEESMIRSYDYELGLFKLIMKCCGAE